MLIAGDFNAKSSMWVSPRTTAREEAVMEWTASHDLRLMNRERERTCVRWNGSFIVDLTWASPALARRTRDWRVRADIEFLSDHLYITMAVGGSTVEENRRTHNTARETRWCLGRMNTDLFQAAIMARVWLRPRARSGNRENAEDGAR